MEDEKKTKGQLMNELAELEKAEAERRRTEQQIRREKEFTSSLLQGLKEGLAVVDQEGMQILVNVELCKMTGYSEKELLGQKPPFKYWAEEGLERINEAFEKTLKGVEGEYELTFKRKDGERFIALVSPRTTTDPDGNTLFFATVKDITEHKKAEEFSRNLFVTSTIGIYIVQDGKFRLANPEFLKLTGYSEDELLGTDSLSLVLPEDRNTVSEEAVKMLKGESLVPYEFRVVTKGGETMWVIEAVTPTSYRGRRATLGHFMDITERKLAEEALQETKQRYQRLFDTMNESLVEVDENRLFTFVNDRFCEMLGYSRDELIGSHPTDFLDEANKQIFEEQRASREEGKHLRYELEFIAKDGRKIPTITSVHRILDGDGNHRASVAMLMDITERKLAEEALKRATELHTTVFNSTNDAISVVDVRDYRIVAANNAFLKQYGLKEEQVIGKTCYEITHNRSEPCTPPDDICPLTDTIITGAHSVAEHVHYDKDGERIYVEVSASPLRDASGNIVQVVHVARSITERKRAEQQLKEYSGNLERMVEERTRELKDAVEKIVRTEKLAAIGELAGGVGHELRNPLAAIKASVYFLKMKMGDVADEKMIKHLDMVDRQVDACVKIISDLLDFSRPGKTTIEEIDINQLIQRVVQATALPQAVEISTSLAGNLPPVLADAGQLQQVFSNLVTNAIQAMTDGGRLSLSTSQSDSFIEVRVADTGVGIPQENLDNVFEPLFTTKAKGVGLGLALVKTLLERQGGTIEVQSQVGKGTTFTVKLPIASEVVLSHEQSNHPGR